MNNFKFSSCKNYLHEVVPDSFTILKFKHPLLKSCLIFVVHGLFWLDVIFWIDHPASLI